MSMLDSPGRSPQGERGLKPLLRRLRARARSSLPARGAWVETRPWIKLCRDTSCRSPQGERGLKHGVALAGAQAEGRSPQGERGLKHEAEDGLYRVPGRSPQGERGLKPGARPARSGAERGLKLGRFVALFAYFWSLPARGAWVETSPRPPRRAARPSRSPQGERGLKRPAMD